jgi:DNA (cytosine-5)-methyltransferase 1
LPAKVRWSENQEEPELKAWLNDPRMDSVCNHETREHMPTDHHRYLFAAAFAAVRGVSPRLRDFPQGLLPEHNNVAASLGHANFADRFRVQVADQPGSTVLSHIAKDGHYFIHPDPFQARSLTVREVARLQTFPDNYAFFGNRGEQYTQIGNAVPPLLSFQIAEVVADVLGRAKPQTPAPGPNTRLATLARMDTTPAEAGPL